MSIITLDNITISNETKNEIDLWIADKEQIRTAISAMMAGIKKDEKPPYLYASTPISTGRRLLEAMAKYGYKSKEDFMKKDIASYRNEVLIPNIQDGNEFSEDCEKNYGLVFAPSKFAGGMRWKDIQYMVFYRPVVEKSCWGMIFNNRAGFCASTGCIEEFSMGLEHKKKILSWDGPGKFKELDLQFVIDESLKYLQLIREVTGEVPTRFAEYWLDAAVRVGGTQNQTDIKKLAEIKKG
ncbi:MAG: hypothetical protein ACP5N1_04875 [Candidatus Woesearchaeota archaeon]